MRRDPVVLPEPAQTLDLPENRPMPQVVCRVVRGRWGAVAHSVGVRAVVGLDVPGIASHPSCRGWPVGMLVGSVDVDAHGLATRARLELPNTSQARLGF